MGTEIHTDADCSMNVVVQECRCLLFTLWITEYIHMLPSSNSESQILWTSHVKDYQVIW